MSPTLKSTVLYLRGLNSRGDDNFRLGGLVFGPMHGPWQRELEKRNVKTLAVTGFGAGALDAQVQKAAQFIQAHPSWTERQPLHLLGHSTGGLMARALVHELKKPEQVLSVTTLATPHCGSPLAEVALQLPRERVRLYQLLKWFGYDLQQKTDSLSALTPANAEVFNRRYPDHPSVHYASVIFGLPSREMAWPFRLLHSAIGPSRQMGASDGLVEVASQKWGEVLAELPWDHIHQIGYSLNPLGRPQFQNRFGALVDRLVTHWQQVEARRSEPAK